MTTQELEKRIYIKALLLGVLVGIAGLILGFFMFSIGIVVGTLTSMLNFKLLAIRTNILTSSGKTPNPFFVIGSYLFRLIIMGAVLWVAINKGLELFLGACLGLFTVTLAIYAETFLNREKIYGRSSGHNN